MENKLDKIDKIMENKLDKIDKISNPAKITTLDIRKYLLKWAHIRGMIFYDHQIEIMVETWKMLHITGKLVLAIAPSAGKTLMSIVLIDAYLFENPGSKILVLAHGQRLLRAQYMEEIEKWRPNFSYYELEEGVNFYEYYNKVDVIVAIPHTLKFLLKSGNKISDDITFDMTVVDEAHQLYLAPGSQALMKKIKPKVQLLMTATPDPYVLRRYDILAFPLFDLPDDLMTDPCFDVLSSEYDYDLQDFNKDQELNKSASDREMTKEKTKLTLNSIVSEISLMIGKEKAIFACRSQAQGSHVYSHFKSLGINALLSVSDTDEPSAEVFNFKEDPDATVLVVVGRGILGFNYPELVNFIDMSGTQNISRIIQMYGRLARKHPENKTKKFIKIVPKRLVQYYWSIMDASMFLASGEWLLLYNGNNFYKLHMTQRIDTGTDAPVSGTPVETKPNRPIRSKPISYAGLPPKKIFKKLAVERKKGTVLEGYITTTLAEARAIITGIPVNQNQDWKNMTEDEILQYVVKLARDKKSKMK